MTAKLNNNKSNGYHTKSNRKERRREEALERETSRTARSSEDQMDLISERRGNSGKEMAGLVRTPPARELKIHIPEGAEYHG